jgi:hypothetical protein
VTTASGKYRGLRTPPPIGRARNEWEQSTSTVAEQAYQVAGEKMLPFLAKLGLDVSMISWRVPQELYRHSPMACAVHGWTRTEEAWKLSIELRPHHEGCPAGSLRHRWLQ